MGYVVTLISFIFISNIAHSTTFMNRPLRDVVEEAPLIVRGQTGDSYSDWGKTDKAIYTYTHFTITEVLKGNFSETRILLRQSGGVKDGIEMSVPGTVGFKIDEDVVVLLSARHPEDGSHDIPGMVTGKYTVVEKNGETYLENSLGAAGVYDPDKDAGTLSYNATILFDDFKKIVKGERGTSSAKQFNPSKKMAPVEKTVKETDEKIVEKTVEKTDKNTDKNTGPNPSNPEEKPEENPLLWIILGCLVLTSGAGYFVYKLLYPGNNHS